MRIKEIKPALWFDAWVMIGGENDNCEWKTVWAGYAGDIPEEYMDQMFDCILPMYDDGAPAIGIQLY